MFQIERPVRIVIGIAGASGVIYGIRLLDELRRIVGVESHLVMTKAAKLNISLETDLSVKYVEELADYVYSINDVGAKIASGSFPVDAMIVAACSMRSLSAIVHSHADDLLVRCADVTLKERRRLVLMPRETPLHLGHCRLLTAACEIGAIIAPPMPAWYARPNDLEDMIGHSVGRVLDLVGLETALVTRWNGTAEAARRRKTPDEIS